MALRSRKRKAHNVDGGSVEIEMEEIGTGHPKVSWCVGFFTDRHQHAWRAQKLATIIASEMLEGRVTCQRRAMPVYHHLMPVTMKTRTMKSISLPATTHRIRLHMKHNRHHLLTNQPPTYRMKYVMFVVCIAYSYTTGYRQDTQLSVATDWHWFPTTWKRHHTSVHNSSITSTDFQGWTAWLGIALNSLRHGWHSFSILIVRTLRDGNHRTCHCSSILVDHPMMKVRHFQTPMSWTSFSDSSHVNFRMSYLMLYTLDHVRRTARHRLHLRMELRCYMHTLLCT